MTKWQYIVVDLEADERMVEGKRVGQTIEIGAVLFAPGQPVTSTFRGLVRPTWGDISNWIIGFCGYGQQEVAAINSASAFPQVLNEFLTWAQSHEGALFASWGDYDRKQLIRDCAVHGSPVPEWLLTHVNIKKDFARCVGGRPCGMRKALDKANLPLDGTHHKGIDDARNIAKLLAYILDRDATLKISTYPC